MSYPVAPPTHAQNSRLKRGYRWGRLIAMLMLPPVLMGSAPEVRRAQLAGDASFRLVMVPPGASGNTGFQVLEPDSNEAGQDSRCVFESGRLRVEWPAGLEGDAAGLAERLERALRQVWGRVGLHPGQGLLVQLRPVHDWPSVVILESRWESPAESHWLPVAVPVLAGNAAHSEEIQGLRFPEGMWFLLAHELTEYVLVTRERGTLLMDTMGPDGRERSYHTRWFREGLATAAAAAICDELGLAKFFSREEGREALGEAGARLLFWTQNQRLDAETNRRYYAAAFEMVSRMDEAGGVGGMARFIEDFDRYDYLNGERLGDLALEHFGRRPLGFLEGFDRDGGRGRSGAAVRRAD